MEQSQWRELGQRLADYLQRMDVTDVTPARVQGLVADLVGEHQALLLPLKDLVSRPAFQALIPLAGSGSGALQRDALVSEIQTTFAQQLVTGLGDLLDGFLELPQRDTGRPAAAEQTVAGGERPAERPLESPEMVPPLMPAAVPVKPTPPPPIAAVMPPQSPQRRPQQRQPALLPLVLLSMITAVAAAGGFVLLRGVDLCGWIGICPDSAVPISGLPGLEAAERAQQALRRASDLEAYERALQQLDEELQQLNNDDLTPQQQERRQQLERAAQDARALLSAEQADAELLRTARQTLAAAADLSGEEQSAQLAAVSKTLSEIPPGSFSAVEASRLRVELERLLTTIQAASQEQESAAPVAPETMAPAPVAAPPPPPVSRSAPSPAPVQPAPRSENDAPYRDQPLF